MKRISAREVMARLTGTEELALLDVREQGVHYRGHPFYACCAPLSRLELVAPDLVPRLSAPIVLLGTDEKDALPEKAGERLKALGYSDLSILEGGCAGWQAAGGELFSGVNVPSKAFGEFVEHHYDTPRIPPEELKRWLDEGRKLVVLDSRPWDEYHRMNIPGGIDVPGAELAYRVHDLAPDADTVVVVNCAGRTRSIIGCQSLRNAGIPNRVVALKDGTMGWELAGYQCERGSRRLAPEPTAGGRDRALAAAARVAERFQVRFSDAPSIRRWQEDGNRTLYLLDVRTREEFERGHLAGARHAPGGQLVQGTDEFVAVRNARIVLIDPERVRAVMTASWLNQMGWDEVYVLDDFADLAVERGPRAPPPFQRWATVAQPEGTVLDLATSLRYKQAHVPGAWWAVRARLPEAREKLGEQRKLVLTSEDGVLAHLAAPEAQALWPQAEVRVLEGGNAAWFAAGRPSEAGLARPTTTPDDVWWKPYDHGADYEKHARHYLSWEVALVEQIKRDPTIRFRTYN